MSGASRVRWLAMFLFLLCTAGQCQENPYVYVKMPLTVPWALYFVFLGAVLIPFVLMIALAWRKRPQDASSVASTPQEPRIESGG